MKNKLLTFVLTAMACLISPCLSAETYNGTCGENLTWTLDTETGILTISGTGAMENYSYHNSDIPWYSYVNSITSIVISDGVTSIGDWAFQECSSLTSVTISNIVTSIGKYAFLYCSSLTSVKIPDGVTSIGDGAFQNCSNLTSITIPNSITSIGDVAFSGCSGLTSITFPQNLTTIGSNAFRGCSGLTSVIWNAINFNDMSYYKTPFYQEYGYDLHKQITSFIFGDNIEHIPACLCYGMYNLTSITIPGSVTSIGDGAFEGCSSLTSINVDVANSAYCDIDGVLFSKDKTALVQYPAGKTATSYTIPASVTSIEGGAFQACSGLTSITFPQNLTSIGTYTFSGCSGLTSVIWNAINFNDMSDYGSTPFYEEGSTYRLCEQITSFIFGDNIEHIPAYLCYGMYNLTSITIPNSVTSIGDGVFWGCSSLPIIENIRYADTYLVEAVDKTLSMYNIKEGTRWIGDEAFYNCSSLTSITIPNSVTSIGELAFYNCSSLTSVTIPNSVTSIGYRAFSDCSKLPSITIPNSVKSIGYNAFYDCSALMAVHISDLTAWCTITFEQDTYGYSSAQTNPLYYAKHLFLDGNEITELEIPADVTDINPYAFVNGSSLTSVRLPQSVETIGKGAFEGCSAVKRIYCHAVTPPAVESETFANYNAYLYVPCSNFEDYDLHDVWGSFKHIECLPEETTALNDPMNGQQNSQAKKILRNGIICIERDGILYDLQGAIIR